MKPRTIADNATESLVAAINILADARFVAAAGPHAAWTKIYHAYNYLDSQLATLLSDDGGAQ